MEEIDSDKLFMRQQLIYIGDSPYSQLWWLIPQNERSGGPLAVHSTDGARRSGLLYILAHYLDSAVSPSLLRRANGPGQKRAIRKSRKVSSHDSPTGRGGA